MVYKSIRCLNLISADSFYFRTNKSGFAFFFRNFDSNDTKKWFDNLIMLVDKDVETKSELRVLDMSSFFDVLGLEQQLTDFKFLYGKTVKAISENRRNSSELSDLICN